MSLTVFNGLTIIILSCLIVFLCFGIFSPLCFDLLSGTWTKPQRLKLVYKQEGWSGTQSGGVPSLRSGLREESPPLPSLVSHSPASLPPVSRGPAPCPCIPWEPTWDSGLPGPLCTPSSERQSCSRQEGVSGWTRPARPRTPTSLPTPRDESLLGAARPACIAGLKTQFPQNEASLLCFMPGP